MGGKQYILYYILHYACNKVLVTWHVLKINSEAGRDIGFWELLWSLGVQNKLKHPGKCEYYDERFKKARKSVAY